MATTNTLPDYGVSPDECIERTTKFIDAAKSKITAMFDADFLKANPELLSQLIALYHADFTEAVRTAQRMAELQKP